MAKRRYASVLIGILAVALIAGFWRGRSGPATEATQVTTGQETETPIPESPTSEPAYGPIYTSQEAIQRSTDLFPTAFNPHGHFTALTTLQEIDSWRGTSSPDTEPHAPAWIVAILGDNLTVGDIPFIKNFGTPIHGEQTVQGMFFVWDANSGYNLGQGVLDGKGAFDYSVVTQIQTQHLSVVPATSLPPYPTEIADQSSVSSTLETQGAKVRSEIEQASTATASSSMTTSHTIRIQLEPFELSVEEFFERADAVVRVSVTEIGDARFNTSDGQRPQYDPGQGDSHQFSIHKPVFLDVLESYKTDGQAYDHIISDQRGGQLEDIVVEVRDNNRYAVNTEGFVFLKKVEPGADIIEAEFYNYLDQLAVEMTRKGDTYAVYYVVAFFEVEVDIVMNGARGITMPYADFITQLTNASNP